MDTYNLTNNHNKNEVLKYLIELISSNAVDLDSITLSHLMREVEIVPLVKEARLSGDFTIVIRGRDRRLI